LLAATLFEAAYSRRAHGDLPAICGPCLGSGVVLLGTLALLQASALVVAALSSVRVASAHALCERFAAEAREALPRTVCISRAFVKSEWEAGKLRCEDTGGHVHCKHAFVAAPIFDDKALADNGLPDNVWAWAVSYGRHISANYQPDGSLCGYLSGNSNLDFYLGDYRLAVQRVMEKYHLQLSSRVDGAALPRDARVPLTSRPLVFVADSSEVSGPQQAWLVAAFFLFCLCPCAGPLPLGGLLIFLCLGRHEDRYAGRHTVPADDYGEAFGEPAYS